MGKQSQSKKQRQADQRAQQSLSRIQLPFPEDLADESGGGTLVDMYLRAAAAFIEPTGDKPTEGSLREGMRRLLQQLDEYLELLPTSLRLAEGVRRHLACKKGCNWCCTIRVSCTAPTILLLADYLRRTLDEPGMAALLGRLQAHEAQTVTLTPLEVVLKARMCPLNVEGLCIGYPARPMTCRTYHSYSVQACIEDATEYGKQPMVPMDSVRMMMRTPVTRALDACLDAYGLDSRELELVPALKIALTEPDAGARYAAGDDVFGPANRPDVREAQEKDMADRGLA